MSKMLVHFSRLQTIVLTMTATFAKEGTVTLLLLPHKATDRWQTDINVHVHMLLSALRPCENKPRIVFLLNKGHRTSHAELYSGLLNLLIIDRKPLPAS